MINVGSVTVNATGEDSSGSGIIVSPSVLGDNNTYTVSINADSINVNSSGWAEGLESTPHIKGNDNKTEFNIHINGDIIAKAGIDASGINAQNSVITVGGNVRTEADGTAKAINVRNNTKVTVVICRNNEQYESWPYGIMSITPESFGKARIMINRGKSVNAFIKTAYLSGILLYATKKIIY